MSGRKKENKKVPLEEKEKAKIRKEKCKKKKCMKGSIEEKRK